MFTSSGSEKWLLILLITLCLGIIPAMLHGIYSAKTEKEIVYVELTETLTEETLTEEILPEETYRLLYVYSPSGDLLRTYEGNIKLPPDVLKNDITYFNFEEEIIIVKNAVIVIEESKGRRWD